MDIQAQFKQVVKSLDLPKRVLTAKKEPIDAAQALALSAFNAATTATLRRRLDAEEALAIIVAVPGSDWVKPISAYLETRFKAERIVRDGSQKKDLRSDDNDAVCRHLAAGTKVIGISHQSDRLLPPILLSSADIRIDIPLPPPAVIGKAMRLCLRGSVPSKLPKKLGVGLTFGQIAAALRRNSTPEQSIKRMEAVAQKRLAAQQDPTLPSLEDCIFYGPARDWGLALAKDVAATRKGLAWKLVPRGAVLYGEPGTGKTMLARLIAQACGLPIIEASVGELFASGTGYLDGVVKAQRAVFDRAAAAAPCVLFWDEIDALPNRATLSDRAREWWMPVVDDFLLLVANAPKGVIMLGATNYLRDVDAALLRPGRLERSIEVKAPATSEGLISILRFHLQSDLTDVDLLPLARLGLGATPAVAMEWVREARRSARNAGRDMVFDDLAAVIAPPDNRPADILRRDAIHEAAHAVAAVALGLDRVKHISLVKHGSTAGHMTFEGLDRVEIEGRGQIEKVITVLLSGRAAEIVCCGEASCGAGGHPRSDLSMATRLSAAIHGSLGLGGSLVYVGSDDDIAKLLVMDPAFRRQVDNHLNRMSATAEHLVLAHRAHIERIAKELISRRHLTGEDVENLMAQRTKPASRQQSGC